MLLYYSLQTLLEAEPLEAAHQSWPLPYFGAFGRRQAVCLS